MRWLRLSVRGKIMLTIVGVATAVLALGAWRAVDVAQPEQRKNFVGSHLQRFLRTLEASNSGNYSVVQIMASDPQLEGGLASSDPGVVAEAAKRFEKPLRAGTSPDLAIISDGGGTTYRIGGFETLSTETWRGQRLFRDLADGKSIRNAVAHIDGEVYRVDGMPIRSGGNVVGTVLLAERVQRYFNEFTNYSTSQDPKLKYYATLVLDDEVLASNLPEGEWDAVARGFAKYPDAREGTISVAGKKLYDFKRTPLSGYRNEGGPSKTVLGDIYITRTRSHVMAEAREETTSILLTFSIALVVSLVVGYLLAVYITKPIRSYITATEDLGKGQGDLTKRLSASTNDELGMLARNLNRVFAKIHLLAAGVQRSAFQVGASSGEISTISRQMHEGAKEQAGKISNSTAAVTELSSSIQQVAENAAEASRAAKQTGEAVTSAISRLDQIRATVEDAARRIETLGESSKRIGNIVEVIRQISEQTTMLALNAAIEAAHAGEHGRGFAVVADEVSSLAKRVGQSARDIEDLIATIRDQTSEAVSVMQSGATDVESGTTLVTDTLADLKKLVNVIDDTASAVQEQAIASDEIARNMDAVQRIAASVLESSENAVNEGDQLQRLADELERSVKGFRIDPDRIADDERELKALPEAGSDAS